MSAVSDALNALLFRESWIFGFIIITILLLVLIQIKREAVIISFPLAIILSIGYLDNNLGWPALLMLIEVILLLFLVARNKKQ